MGSRSTAKSSRNKAVTSGGSKPATKSGNANEKQNRGDETEELDDLSILRKSVGTSVNGLLHALKVFQSGTEEIRSLLSQECKVIYECRVCENLFRSLANFLSHKRIYCCGVALASHPTNNPPSQPNGLLPCIGQQGNETTSDGSLEMVIVEPEPPPKRHRIESPDDWICNESTPHPDASVVDPLPKLENSVPPIIRRRKDICGVIEKLSKRASRQNLANATAVASHYATLTGRKLCLDNAMTTSTSKALYMENIPETKNAMYQTLLCKTSSSMKLGVPSAGDLEPSKLLAIRELGEASREITNPNILQDSLPMVSSLPKLPIVASRLSDSVSSYNENNFSPRPPVPRDLLIKKRVDLLKDVISQNERVVLDTDGVIIPVKTNGPVFPPEVCSGGVSNSEGEEVEDDDEDGDDVSPASKGKTKGMSSKAPSMLSSEEKNRDIICSLCKARFSTRKTLSHHMKSLHVMFRTYFRCPCCKNCFANNWSVYRHLYKVHRKTTDQVRKLRALIKKKAFRKKILLPLPNSLPPTSDVPSTSEKIYDDLKLISNAPAEKVSPIASGKQSSSVSSSTGRVLSGPGRSGSPLPPPSEATQFPAISAQHAQVLRKLENIVKQEDSHWRLESFPERPGMGQSCPGCNRRFERRAALASHAHSCHKRILLAAQKASRARNKQNQQKSNKAGGGAKGGKGADEIAPLETKESPTKLLANEKREIGNCPRTSSTVCNSEQSEPEKIEDDDSFKSQTSSQTASLKSLSELSINFPNTLAGISSKSSPEANEQTEKAKEEDWEEMERPNSASSFSTYRDSSSPITIQSHPNKQQRIGIQIRKDYVKGDRGSVCSSGTSPTPYSASQVLREEEEADDEVVIISSTFPKNPMETGSNCSKDSSTSAITAELCSDLEGSDNLRPMLVSPDLKKGVVEKKELVLKLEDILSNKKESVCQNAFRIDKVNSSDEQIVCSVSKEETSNDYLEKTRGEEDIIGSHGEVKRVFLEVIVGGVADPNSLTVDEEENGKVEEDKVSNTSKKEKKEVLAHKRTAPVKSKPPSSSITVQRQGGRPVRNRVKVEREDFIYDLSDMRLSPAKREDLSSGSSHGFSSLKRPRRNIAQQNCTGSISQSAGNSLDGSSNLKQVIAPGSMIKVDGLNKGQVPNTLCPDEIPTLRVYSGKASGNSLTTDRSNKSSISTGSSVISSTAGSHKVSDCRVVIGGLSGDMTQLSVRRVYGSRKILSPSNMTPVTVEHEDVVSCNTLKKYNRNKECKLGLGDVDEGLFGEMGKGEISLSEKQTSKNSLLYQSDSLDSIDSTLSDCGSVSQRKNPVAHSDVKPKT